MKQRILVSGRGGQGVLTLTRLLAEAALAAGHEVITSETHGMAQRGGAVLSTVKVGPFHGPLVAPGEAEVALVLAAENLSLHGRLLRPGGRAFVDGPPAPGYEAVPAAELARSSGAAVSANLVLLGFAAARGGLFADPAHFEAVLRASLSARRLERGLTAFRAGVGAAG